MIDAISFEFYIDDGFKYKAEFWNDSVNIFRLDQAFGEVFVLKAEWDQVNGLLQYDDGISPSTPMSSRYFESLVDEVEVYL